MKKFSIIKRLFSLSLIFLLSINSFATSVGDNDGSAFITKAEFDSLKNNFQAQIDTYTQGIDSKIDNAIASYLSGMRIGKKNSFTGFIDVTSSSNYIYGAKTKDYTAIKNQMWNNVSYTLTVMAWAGSGYTLKPWSGGGSATFYKVFVQDLSCPWNGMSAYVIDKNEEGVINSYFNIDTVSFVMTQTACVDAWGVQKTVGNGWKSSGFGGNKIETEITSGLSMTGDRLSGDYKAPATIKANAGNYVWDPDVEGAAPSGYNSGKDDNTGRFANMTYNLIYTHGRSSEDKDIYIFNECDAKIYAYIDDETEVETFTDPIADASCDVHKGMKKFQMIYDQSDAHVAEVIYGAGVSSGERNTSHRFIEYLPKVKLKNKSTNASFKPGTDGFNNLNQFYNGKLDYTDVNDKTKTIHSKFYEGVPLFDRSLSKGELTKVKFKIKGESIVTGGNKLRIWIKKSRFPNGAYGSSTWTSVNPETGKTYNNDLIVVTSDKDETNTKKYIDIDFNVLNEIRLDKPEKNCAYYLRFAEVDSGGTCLNVGGKITYLSEFEEELE